MTAAAIVAASVVFLYQGNKTPQPSYSEAAARSDFLPLPVGTLRYSPGTKLGRAAPRASFPARRRCFSIILIKVVIEIDRRVVTAFPSISCSTVCNARLSS
jgi:hypothetical protein